jgi:SAM-dependent methyltransferase
MLQTMSTSIPSSQSNFNKFKIPFAYKYLNPYFYFYALERRLNNYIDRKAGLDFTIVNYKPKELGLNPKESYSSEPSGNVFLGRVIKDLGVSKNDAIIDVGCGKGSAMRYMLKFPFKVVAGVEISGQLCSIAQKNFEIMNAKNTIIYHSDATLFEDYDDFNIIYFYNPFPEVIMEKVIKNLAKSLERKPRKLTIIYDFPTCHETIIASGLFRQLNSEKMYRDQQGFDINLYTNVI